jgi:hypothetical protein
LFHIVALHGVEGQTLGQIQSAIQGTVTDPTGGAIPNARITLIRDGRPIRQVVSSSDGRFSLPLPSSGIFDVEVEVDGFAKQVFNGIRAQVGQ